MVIWGPFCEYYYWVMGGVSENGLQSYLCIPAIYIQSMDPTCLVPIVDAGAGNIMVWGMLSW